MFANNSIIPAPTKRRQPIKSTNNNAKQISAYPQKITDQVDKKQIEDGNIIKNSILKFNNTNEIVPNFIQLLQWNGTILKRGIYSPYIIDCSGSSSSFTSITSFENPTIFDYRERGTYTTLKGLSILYPAITVLWILNGLSFPQFFVDMHHYLTFLPIFKAGVLILESELYGNKYVDPIDVAWSLVASVVLHSVSITVLLMIAGGWCTYEEEMQPRDVAIYIILPATMLISSAMSNYSVLFTYLMKICLASFALLIASMYTRIIKKLRASRASIARAEQSMEQPDNNNNNTNNETDNNEISNDINEHQQETTLTENNNFEEEEEESDAHCDPNYVKKLEMVLRFMNYCTANIAIFFLLSEISMWMNTWAIVRIVIIELGILNMFIIEMCFFFYRADHAPIPVNFAQYNARNNRDINNDNSNKGHDRKSRITKLIKTKIAVLIEPNSRRLFCMHVPM